MWTNQRRVSPVLAGDAVAVAHAAPQPGPSLLEHLLRQVPQADQRVLAHAAEPKHYTYIIVIKNTANTLETNYVYLNI